MPQQIGKLFPLGGPVPPDLMIGRAGERGELERRLEEGMSTMLVGPRRAGKTTVCGAACDTLVRRGYRLFDLEVPERADSTALLQLMVDRATRISLADEAGAIAQIARPMIERFLGDQGVPLDLSALDRDVGPADARAILTLPLELARSRRTPTILFFDELQRAVSYADGEEILLDLVDLYSAPSDVVVLVDGSDERALDGMLGPPLHFGKLVDRQTLDPHIPLTTWREPLTERFAAAGLVLPGGQLERLLEWSGGAAYPTMAAARFTAFSAQKTSSTTIEDFDVDMGLDEARRHVEDDGA
jgi:hypothetical protein